MRSAKVWVHGHVLTASLASARFGKGVMPPLITPESRNQGGAISLASPAKVFQVCTVPVQLMILIVQERFLQAVSNPVHGERRHMS